MSTTTTKTPTAKHCQCFTRFDEKQDAYVACTAHTAREFAPGHDARLKGLLIRLHVAGKDYVRLIDGAVVTTSPLAVATERNWDGYLAAAGVRHAAKVAAANEKKAKREAAKAERAAAKAQHPSTRSLSEMLPDGKPAKPAKPATKKGFHPVTVKIGRWEYDANIVAEDVNSLTVSYTDKKGNTVIAEVKRSQVVN